MAVNSISAVQPSAVQVAATAQNRQPAQSENPAVEAQKLDSVRRAQAATDVRQVRAAGDPEASAPVDRKELDDALDAVRKVVEPVARNLQFTVDEDTGRTVVKVVDGATKEVIRQIPSEEILAIAKALDKLKGLLIKQQA